MGLLGFFKHWYMQGWHEGGAMLKGVSHEARVPGASNPGSSYVQSRRGDDCGSGGYRGEDNGSGGYRGEDNSSGG